MRLVPYEAIGNFLGSLLPDGDPRPSTADRETGTKVDEMDQSPRVGEGGPEGRAEVQLCTLGAQGQLDAQGGIQARSRPALDRAGDRATRDPLLQGVQEPAAYNRTGARNCWVDARLKQVEGLLPGDDLR